MNFLSYFKFKKTGIIFGKEIKNYRNVYIPTKVIETHLEQPSWTEMGFQLVCPGHYFDPKKFKDIRRELIHTFITDDVRMKTILLDHIWNAKVKFVLLNSLNVPTKEVVDLLFYADRVKELRHEMTHIVWRMELDPDETEMMHDQLWGMNETRLLDPSKVIVIKEVFADAVLVDTFKLKHALSVRAKNMWLLNLFLEITPLGWDYCVERDLIIDDSGADWVG